MLLSLSFSFSLYFLAGAVLVVVVVVVARVMRKRVNPLLSLSIPFNTCFPTPPSHFPQGGPCLTEGIGIVRVRRIPVGVYMFSSGDAASPRGCWMTSVS